MINDIRRSYWNNPRNRAPRDEHDLTDSLPYPFEPIQSIFNDRDVLEIGPGRGRQYEKLKDIVESYSICDISQAALNEVVFATLNNRFLLEDYKDDFHERFDVVHFWYVLHHVRLDEMFNFFNFVARHLKSQGLAAFNCPEPVNVQGNPEGDGFGTTYSDPEVVKSTATGFETVKVLEIQRKSTGFVFLLRKRD